MNAPHDNIATIATDGSYLYLHDVCGLVKVGTGLMGTQKGSVNVQLSNFEPREKGWLVCIDKKLYYRSNLTRPASIIVLDSETLQVSSSFIYIHSFQTKILFNFQCQYVIHFSFLRLN
jgi:hypothetical protein